MRRLVDCARDGERWSGSACSGARSIPCTSGTSSSPPRRASRLGLDRVLLVVAGDPWQKRGRVVASARDRLALVELAVAERRGRRGVGDRGRARRRVGHRRHARGVARRRTRALPRPRRRRGGQHGDLAAARRDPRPRHRGGRRARRATRTRSRPATGGGSSACRIPRLDISSTDLRDRLAAGRPVDGLVPPAVVRAIHARGSTLAVDDVRWRSTGPLDFGTHRPSDPRSPEAQPPSGRHRRSGRRRQEGRRHRRPRRRRHHLDHRNVRARERRRTPARSARSSTRSSSRSRCSTTTSEGPRSVEGLDDATWVLMDYGDVIVHVFLAETRATTTSTGCGPTPRVDWEPPTSVAARVR